MNDLNNAIFQKDQSLLKNQEVYIYKKIFTYPPSIGNEKFIERF